MRIDEKYLHISNNQMQYFEDTDIASNPTSKLLSQYPATGN